MLKPQKLDVSSEELRLAWNRTKADHPDRTFVSHPHLFSWLDHDLEGWLDNLKKRLVNGYVPKSCQICFVPKPASLLRPAAVLEVDDEAVYNLLVGKLMPPIYRLLADFQGDPDIASQLTGDENSPTWVKSAFVAWNELRQKSLQLIDNGAQYVVVADVAGFYENIDLFRLMSDLRSVSDSGAGLALLDDCLKKWSQPRSKGIPQGYTASDILAKVYMNNVDRGLINEDFVHLRYNDDIRIFCQSKLEARKAICRLTQLMYQRGLNLQSAKTKIMPAARARARFEGVATVIHGVQEQLTEELREELDLENPYLSTAEIDQFLETPDINAPEVLERTFDEKFNLSGAEEFDKSLFRYLLGRLGRAGSRVAVDYCMDALRNRPEETAAILDYFGNLKRKKQDAERIITFIASAEAIYDFQLFQIIRWFFDLEIPDKKVLRLCRKWAFDYNREPWLRSYSLGYLGKFGDTSDLELIESKYAALVSEAERADCALALRRQERSRRNAFYGRIIGDGDLVRRAVEIAKRSG